MATLDPNFSLQDTHIYLPKDGSRAWSYDTIPLNDALPDAQQLHVRWNVTTVYQVAPQGSVGAIPVTVNTLTQSLQDSIQTLTPTMYTVDPTANTVTLSADAAIQDQITHTNYYFPNTFAVTSFQPIIIRRDTNVTNPIVTFSPGSRLSSELLNISDAQLLNSIQEVVAFGSDGGSGGDSGDVDLNTHSIFELGDVAPQSGNGLLSWDGTEVITGGAGSLVPAGGLTHYYLRKATNADGVVEWHNLDDDLETINTSIILNSHAITTLQGKTERQSHNNGTTSFNGDLLATDDLRAENRLFVTNSINAGDEITAGGNITALGSSSTGATFDSKDVNGLRARFYKTSTHADILTTDQSGLRFRNTAGSATPTLMRIFGTTGTARFYDNANDTNYIDMQPSNAGSTSSLMFGLKHNGNAVMYVTGNGRIIKPAAQGSSNDVLNRNESDVRYVRKANTTTLVQSGSVSTLTNYINNSLNQNTTYLYLIESRSSFSSSDSTFGMGKPNSISVPNPGGGWVLFGNFIPIL